MKTHILSLLGFLAVLLCSCSPQTNALCFTCTDGLVHLSLLRGNAGIPVSLECSKDGKEWTSFVLDSTEVALSKGESIYLRAEQGVINTRTTGFSLRYDYFANRSSDKGAIRISGDFTTLIKSEGAIDSLGSVYEPGEAEGAFASLFEGLTVETDASRMLLPSTSLEDGCYSGMFQNCKGLVEAPALPAKRLKRLCYHYMFNGCSSLRHKPQIAAEQMAEDCMLRTFEGCTSLCEKPNS